MSDPSAPPGYHPDPWSPENLRWWDGEQWTLSTIPKLPALPGGSELPGVPVLPGVVDAGVDLPDGPELPGVPVLPGVVDAGVDLPGAAEPAGEVAPTGLAWVDDLVPAPTPRGRTRPRAPVIAALVAVVVLVFGGVAMLALGGDDGGSGTDDPAASSPPSTLSSVSRADSTSESTSAAAAGSGSASSISDAPAASGPDPSGSVVPAPNPGSTAPAATVATTTVTPATPAPGPSPTSPAPVVGPGGAFGDPLGNFRLLTGPTWERISESGDQVSGWFVGPSAGGLRENVNVVTEMLTSPDVTIDAYLDAAIDQLDRSQPDLDVVDRRTVTLVSGAIGGRVEYGGSINEVDVRIVQIVAIGSGKAVVATFTASPSRFDSTVTGVEPFLLTLEVV